MDSNYKNLTEVTKNEVLEIAALQDGWKEESKKGTSVLYTRKYKDAAISLVKVVSNVP